MTPAKFFLIGTYSIKAEQILQGTEYQEKEEKDEKQKGNCLERIQR